ncbi:MAG: hypothetical protein AAF433_16195 [Bacteroidota bacterium]
MPVNEEEDRLEEAAKAAISTEGRQQLRLRMEQLEKDWQKSQSPTRPVALWRRPQAWLLAAAVVLFVILGWRQLISLEQPQDLFAQYFEPYRSPTITRGEAVNQEDWQSAVGAYQAADYARAITGFQAAKLREDSLGYLLDFYLANSYLAQTPPQTDLAIEALTTVLNGDHLYREQARWLLALAHLAAEGTIESSQLLNQIVEDKSYQWEAAAELLVALKE